MIHTRKVLIVDDEEIALQNLEHVLTKEGYEVAAVDNGPEALQRIRNGEFCMVLTDLKMEKVDGMRILKETKEKWPDTEVIMITGFATVDSAIEAMKSGAYHYIAKPYKLDEVRKVVREACEKYMLRKENLELKSHLKEFRGDKQIVTANDKLRELLTTARQVAETDCNIIISGESGTGKELFARYIHNESRRSDGPMLSINCGVFTEELLSNELFGHEKGAFTGADEARKGLVEMADGGTLFLDEITEMDPQMQVRLLRVIQEKEVMRVGGTKPLKVDVRFIAATNRNLQEEVKEGKFRQDLFFRMNVVSFDLPPLAERRDDIPLLANHFLNKYRAVMNKNIRSIDDEAMELLKKYEYPGNIRELENIIERGVALATGEVLSQNELPDDLRLMQIQTFRKKNGRFASLEDQEKDYIATVLAETGGNKQESANILGIDRVSLWRKIKKYGLE